MSKCEYCATGGYGDLLHETPYWMIFLAPSQRYLGTCVIALKRECQSLSDLEDEEWTDFILIVRKMEHSMDKSFKPALLTGAVLKTPLSGMMILILKSIGILYPDTGKKLNSAA